MTTEQTMEQQQQVVDFLRDATHWPEPVEKVEHVETHISHLFLGRALALKMKKALKLPYLDFSTLERRRHYCRRELEVNARFSPQLYLGLSRVMRTAGGALALELEADAAADAADAPGDGCTLEWLVRMRRFADDAILANLFRHTPPDARMSAALAAMACAAHKAAPVQRKAPFTDTLLHVHAQVSDALLPRQGALCSNALPEVLHTLRKRLQQAMPRLEERAKAGYVRRCHGDMHLDNIVLWQGAPVLFDAIEFDEALATIDVLYDLAFLLMDLRHRRLAEAANRVFNGWLARCDDENNHRHADLMAPLMALRALIRAMVISDLAVQQEKSAIRAEKLRQAARYIDTASACLAPAQPLLIAIGGLSGTGKTTLSTALATRLAPAAGMVHLRSDVERKVMAGADEFDRLPPEAYTAEASRQVYERLNRRAAAALAAPWPVVVDAVFAKAEERAAIEQVARQAGVPFIGLWLDAPEELLRQRVAARATARSDASDAGVAVLQKQLAYDLGPITWRTISAAGTPEQALRQALRMLTP